MHRYIILCCLTLVMSLSVSLLHAQETDAPDYQLIGRQIHSSKSSFFYPTLMARYAECDTTLTLEEYRILYYGYVLQEDYVPYQEENQEVLRARLRLARSGASLPDCQEAISVAEKALLNNPFDLPSLSILPICYLQLGDSLRYQLWNGKLHGVLEAIRSSGDGESVQTAMHVINVEHEYEILNRMGLELDQIEVVAGQQTDFVRVKENTENIKGIYFNFGACAKYYRKKYE